MQPSNVLRPTGRGESVLASRADMTIAKLIADRKVPRENVDAVLELAYLGTAADGRLDDAELTAFAEVAMLVVGGSKPANVDALLDRFAANVEHEEIQARATALAKGLPPELRELAFEIVVALGIADLDTSRDEMELEDMLMEALGLSPARADELTAKVYEAFNAGSD